LKESRIVGVSLGLSKIEVKPTLDRESIASQCMDIHRNPRIFKWITIKAWIIED